MIQPCRSFHGTNRTAMHTQKFQILKWDKNGKDEMGTKGEKNTHLNLNIVSTMSRHSRQNIERKKNRHTHANPHTHQNIYSLPIEWRKITAQSIGFPSNSAEKRSTAQLVLS